MSTAADLGRPIAQIATWFLHEQETPYYLIRISEAQAAAFPAELAAFVRRCYISDSLLTQGAQTHPIADVLASKMPDPGATMSGDFGEILTHLYNDVRELPQTAIGPRKWRLKQDRTKPAPHIDLVHFVLPNWPASSTSDILVCSEVKAKATSGASTPILSAIADIEKKPISRLARTLAWLKERSQTEDLGDISMGQIDRFIKAIDHPPATRKLRAVAVICSTISSDELQAAPLTVHPEYEVVIVVVPNLLNTYTTVFGAASQSVAGTWPPDQAEETL